MESFIWPKSKSIFVRPFSGVRLLFAATVISFMNFDQTWAVAQLFYSEIGKKIWRHCNDCFAPLITAKWWKGQMNACRIIVNFYLISSFVWWQHVLPSLKKMANFMFVVSWTNNKYTTHVPFVNDLCWIVKTCLELDRAADRNVLTEEIPLWLRTGILRPQCMAKLINKMMKSVRWYFFFFYFGRFSRFFLLR